jgi:hypothetical protein
LTQKRVNRRFPGQIRKADCAEPANVDAGLTPGAGPLVYFGHVFTSEKQLQPVGISDHSQTVGAVAVAYASDKRGLESPQGVYERFFLERTVQIQGLGRSEALKEPYFRSRPERFQEGFFDVQQFFGVDSQAEAKAVVGPAGSVLAANARNANDGVCQSKHFLNVFDGDNLAEMVPALPLFYYRKAQVFQRGGRLLDLQQLPFYFIASHGRLSYEISDEPAPSHIREQLLGIILGLQVPLLSFSMLVAELTHKIPDRK